MGATNPSRQLYALLVPPGPGWDALPLGLLERLVKEVEFARGDALSPEVLPSFDEQHLGVVFARGKSATMWLREHDLVDAAKFVRAIRQLFPLLFPEASR